MSIPTITIVDYGAGNLFSVFRAFEVCGAININISKDPDEIRKADRLVLPGVGAFADGMRGLSTAGIDQAIRDFAYSGRPLLGICLGMQMLATRSDEFGNHAGLDLIPGIVNRIPSKCVNNTNLKIPYIGWSNLSCPSNKKWKGSILKTLTDQQSVYLVHSFQFSPDTQSHLLATYLYGGHHITAAVASENIWGLQFHPEKSGQIGLKILSSFLML